MPAACSASTQKAWWQLGAVWLGGRANHLRATADHEEFQVEDVVGRAGVKQQAERRERPTAGGF